MSNEGVLKNSSNFSFDDRSDDRKDDLLLDLKDRNLFKSKSDFLPLS